MCSLTTSTTYIQFGVESFRSTQIVFFHEAMALLIIISALLAGFVLGLVMAGAVIDFLQWLLWMLLRWVRSLPRELWRVSGRLWHLEISGHSHPLVPDGCSNCEYWDTLIGRPQASQMHAAMDHVWNTQDGLRNGQEEADPWMSTTPSAAVVIWRATGAETDLLLHHIILQDASVALDLRHLVRDASHLDDQCLECRKEAIRRGLREDRTLPVNGGGYCRKWGVWLQEVLLPRYCPGGYEARTKQLTEGSFPPWACQLASEVVLHTYRRREDPTARASWRDLWAFVQEHRLRRLLLQLFRE